MYFQTGRKNHCLLLKEIRKVALKFDNLSKNREKKRSRYDNSEISKFESFNDLVEIRKFG